MFNIFLNREIKWNRYPGCFERHLQRRYKNPLFPIDRQEVSQENLQEARQQDSKDCQEFFKLYVYGSKGDRSSELNEFSSIDDHTLCLKDLHETIKKAYEIEGDLRETIIALEKKERILTDIVLARVPNLKESLQEINSLNFCERMPLLAQMNRPDSPIKKNEEVSSILSEKLEIIGAFAIISGSFPDYKPSIHEVSSCLKEAVGRGLKKEIADKILNVWEDGEKEGRKNRSF